MASLSRHSRTAFLHRTVREVMGRMPPHATRGTLLSEAIGQLRRPPHRLLAVTDEALRPVGVLTHSDIVRQFGATDLPERPLQDVMTRPAACVEENDHLLYAIADMRRRGLEQMAVVDATGRLVGLLHLTDALLAFVGPAARLLDLMTGDDTLEGLTRIKEGQCDLAEALLGDHVPAPHVLQIITEINADLHRRALQMLVAEMAAQGWGEPPVGYALIVMGSAGRGENGLAPDQDNALILADHDDGQRAAVDAYFSALADRLAPHLATIGFTLCKGGVMASSTVWRRPLSGWQAEIESWIRQRKPEQLLQCDILFDFAHVAGDRRLTDRLRSMIVEASTGNKRLIKALYAIESDHRVALNWRGRLKVDTSEDDDATGMNLKMSGTLPLVEGARLLSLLAGVPSTGTLARLDGISEKGMMPPRERDELAAAFTLVSGILLRQQVASARGGIGIDDYVHEDALSNHERAQLVTAFRAIATFRARLKSELGGGPFG